MKRDGIPNNLHLLRRDASALQKRVRRIGLSTSSTILRHICMAAVSQSPDHAESWLLLASSSASSGHVQRFLKAIRRINQERIAWLKKVMALTRSVTRSIASRTQNHVGYFDFPAKATFPTSLAFIESVVGDWLFAPPFPVRHPRKDTEYAIDVVGIVGSEEHCWAVDTVVFRVPFHLYAPLGSLLSGDLVPLVIQTTGLKRFDLLHSVYGGNK